MKKTVKDGITELEFNIDASPKVENIVQRVAVLLSNIEEISNRKTKSANSANVTQLSQNQTTSGQTQEDKEAYITNCMKEAKDVSREDCEKQWRLDAKFRGVEAKAKQNIEQMKKLPVKSPLDISRTDLLDKSVKDVLNEQGYTMGNDSLVWKKEKADYEAIESMRSNPVVDMVCRSLEEGSGSAEAGLLSSQLPISTIHSLENWQKYSDHLRQKRFEDNVQKAQKVTEEDWRNAFVHKRSVAIPESTIEQRASTPMQIPREDFMKYDMKTLMRKYGWTLGD